MKKIVSIVAILVAIFMVSFSIISNAAALDTINITTTEKTVHPGKDVKVNVDFGKDLGAYTVDVAYDNKLFDYVSAEGGTADDNGTRVRVTFYDTTGGTNPRKNMSVTFKAKNVETSNPTDFSITAEGLANPDASVSYDDIGTPIVKNIIVEPDYKDYDIKLNYSGDVIKNTEKEMKLIISSAMGKNYEHTRIIAEVKAPKGATAKLLAIDSQKLEHDIIQSGWGDASGDPIGGKNVAKELAVRGLFSESGKYTLTFKLIDRDNSDKVIEEETVSITVKDKKAENTTTQKPSTSEPNTNGDKVEEQETPSTMPQTGNTVYVFVIPTILALTAAYVLLKKKN